MKISKTYIISQIIFLGLFLMPYLSTRTAPHVDGMAFIGWPMTIYSYGGLCPEGLCQSPVSILAIIVDALVVIGIPIALHLFVSRKRRGTA